MINKIAHDSNEFEKIVEVMRGDAFEHFPYKITGKKYKKVRSINQNSLYWKWISCIEDETGQDKEDLHDYFRQKYLGSSINETLGEQFMVLRSTANLDSSEFTEYLDLIKRFAAQRLSISLPQPGDQGWDQFNERYWK